jgi:mycothiol synthase
MIRAAVRSFRPGDEAGIRRVMEASLATDGIPGFQASDIDRSITRIPIDPEGTVVAVEDGEIAGYCIPRHDDLTVDPGRRRRGHGRRLVEAALGIVRARGIPHLNLYAPTHLEATRAFIEALGFRYHSSLWELRLEEGSPTPAPAFPAGVAVRGYAGEADLAAYTSLMNLTFADHPTPVSWSEDLVRAVHAVPDFDPGDILLLTPAGRPGELIGFIRVETVPAEETEADRLEGYVALIGVLPEWRGRGLGRQLLYWGIARLRERGAGAVELSVQALNERATRIYTAAGFVPVIEWPQYVLPVDAALPATPPPPPPPPAPAPADPGRPGTGSIAG